MSGDFVCDGELVPPQTGNFTEYQFEAGDFSEKAADAMHKFRTARAALLELLNQQEDIDSDIRHNLRRMRQELGLPLNEEAY